MNICMSYGNGKFKAYGLELVYKYFLEKGNKIIIILP